MTEIATLKEQVSEKGSVKSSVKILALLKEDNYKTTKDLAEIIGISQRAVEKQLAKLQEQKKLDRIGPANGGYWQVINEVI